jgi:hypothetical protein
MSDARDYAGQAVTFESAGDADALVFPEIGSAVVGGAAFESRGLSALANSVNDSAIEAIQPEYFAFAQADDTEYLRGFRRAVEAITEGLTAAESELEPAESPLVAGATWGLIACKVPPSPSSGAGINVGFLEQRIDRGHPDFANRTIVEQSFVPPGAPAVHAMAMVGTACGPKAPAGAIPRYGIGYKTGIYVAQVLSGTGAGTTASILAGMNWTIANRLPVIVIGLGSNSPVQTAYTNAGTAALSRGCLMIASAGRSAGPTGAPANSPTIMAVASLNHALAPSAFSNLGKIDIAAPGEDTFTAAPRPQKYVTLSGTSLAAAHVGGCAALWAETSPAMRAMTLWKKLQTTAKRLPFPATKVGAGLVQAP